MSNFQASWNTLRHSKWTTLSTYALFWIALALLSANIIVTADVQPDISDAALNDLAQPMLSNREFFFGGGLMGAGLTLYLVGTLIAFGVKPTWAPRRSEFRFVWIGYWASMPFGAVLAVILTPPALIDYAFGSWSEFPFTTTAFPVVALFVTSLLWPNQQVRSLPRPEAGEPQDAYE